MAQFLGGMLRLSVRRRNGDIIRSSKPVAYSVYDNLDAPRVVMNDRFNATNNDQPEDFPELVHGNAGEYLTLDFFHTAAVTLATAACLVTLLYEAYSRDPRNGSKLTRPGMLRIGDRIIKSGATAANDAVRGINDNKVTVANEWTPVIAFLPAVSGENVMMKGFQHAVIDGV
jgi:hypothetical protein